MDKLEQKIIISNLKNLSSIYYTGSQKKYPVLRWKPSYSNVFWVAEYEPDKIELSKIKWPIFLLFIIKDLISK